jgi:hypothetical protein
MMHNSIYKKKYNKHVDGFYIFRSHYEGLLPLCIINLINQFSEPKVYIFDTLYPSTLTAQGVLSNVKFEEKDLIFVLNPIGRIKKITCNYGEIRNTDYNEEQPKKKATNRGRKPKIKKRNIRKNQGNGKYFNSQITFWIQSLSIMTKYYKIKLFRNGTIEIPGGLEPSMDDVWSAVNVVKSTMSDCLAEEVNIVELYSIMRNYKFETVDKTIRININKLYNIFINTHAINCKSLSNIAEIKYNIERYPGLIIKFSTPIERNPLKQTTVKMFQSGKVNIDGAISEECALFYYNWINDFYVKHESEVVYIPIKVVLYSDSDTDDTDPNYIKESNSTDTD